MPDIADFNHSSSALARRALLTTAFVTIAGSALGVVGIKEGTVAGPEIALTLSCLLAGVGTLVTLLVCRKVALQTIATVSTVYYAVYLAAAVILAVYGREHENVHIYLVWFFPLLLFNKLVNGPVVGRFLAKGLLVAPMVLLGCLSLRLIEIFKVIDLFKLGSFCLSYAGFGLMFDTVTRYREEYIVERERADSLRVESKVFENISDCFISLDARFRLVYLNDAACAEFGVERSAALNETVPNAARAFFSKAMLAGLQVASAKESATMFEAQNNAQDRWYEMRCFPRPGGLSVYFRNITESVSSRRSLEEAQRRVRDQAELLDKAQDAIFVHDLDNRILYWNKSAERLYGWTAEEVTGKLVGDIFQKTPGPEPAGHDTASAIDASVATLLQQGEWGGELSQRHRDGSALIVESRCTLVTAEDGRPRSILAINTDITNRKAAEAKIRHLAFYDALTDLPNRRLLRERLDKALAAAIDKEDMGAVLFIDLDDFKTLNDTLGHGTGDLLLQQVALRLASCVRKSDTVARFGGDEFVVILEGLSSDAGKAAAEAQRVGEKILQAFLKPHQVGTYECNSTGSIGITLFPGWSDTVEDLLKRADLAMYRAKARARNELCFFDPAMQTLVASRATLLSDLRRAIQDREFQLHYQPQVDSNGWVLGAEALLRWKHRRGGMVPPNEFIPLAEEAGLIVELGRWVLETACAELARWALRPDMERLTIAVNVSLRQFLDANFVSLVQQVLRESGANPRRLKLEITETSAMENVDDTIDKMTALKASGVGFSLDDFGTGHSSLSHLKRLPLDQLKIDRSFVSDVLTDAKDASIARAIVMLGRELNLSVLAEGVETEGQRGFFLNEGCHALQGYLFSQALAAPQFEAFVAAARLVPA